VGLFAGDLRFLVSAKKMGLKGGSACTLGRQVLFFSEGALEHTLREFDQPIFGLPKGRSVFYADDMLKPLGFEDVDVMDVSDYEGANVIHDLNCLLPPHMHEKYDLVLDGGTLEHVFNFPVAIENAMRLVKVGGHVMISSPANNYCGHGFYQLSPELFFRTFTPENGFEILRIYMQCGENYYHIYDPAAIRDRVELVNSKPALIMFHARKIKSVPNKIQTPQQSDYVAIWNKATEEEQSAKQDSPFKSFIRRNISVESVMKISRILFLLRLRQNDRRWRSRSRLSNKDMFVPVQQWDITTHRALPQKSPSHA
jgi:SAM-dependent methyltransferase